ncbi:MAG: imidazole glycerol phosphate synthase subunit HisH [Clostridium baratii]|uniref:Imidazole glycerol phosphate synthase subunit HisH n=1 Tax=Clostridium baratii str. Sullivan TaxID=1415775 RepID=A0A0A7FYM0_9CLOT|nr:imidazole glycerol phosphate synthase subunit HisH [Clostridium baratii]AIY83921.1 imidazole glycerol phosphate synthase, glutamine amidotransferase subunit [Clostridium baratii str. Sullivan]MBS6005611.1 imidazole glycerol phosphate synthase subunit HisH [Clostridium baratii]MDU1052677.1 imidazole glycerol phosphate synthase subunit HisH [Clostridium baratii]MDU4910173.1 imidazole glycerol phosphate synthase subunit HisH [Clostridium baratii]CUP28913.1 imidazole glycerol phosphate synthase
MIGIIDYGMGNLKSICNALESINEEYLISAYKYDLRKCSGLILPGVGSFKEGMFNLRKDGLYSVVKEVAETGKPLLGICLGMQLLFEKGYEGEETKGIGLLKGKVIKMNEEKFRVPNIGWNSLNINKDDELVKGLKEESHMYYVHSYYADEYDKENLVASSDYYGLNIPGIVRRDNIIGVQFHPEKSGEEGIKFLENFCKICK